ncbi:hypothetical protein K435DRAFT_974074 [Dendrothele bispora CBS 962.96]|uniref:Cora-domain-containing protein n=1 Tax=Dendrothele bispora (strain CBS 962.96) TaxID=1314807 RepID=A0A4S8KNI4_DENBC|nr:hypothetical protein K435DRAFT_974074 [Dendrothele bispora CBS 962.96]
MSSNRLVDSSSSVDVNDEVKLPRPTSFRHGTPSGPWPWLDLQEELDLSRFRPPPSRSSTDFGPNEWSGYPEAQFPNWTDFQRKKSGIKSLVEGNTNPPSTQIYEVNICQDGTFDSPPLHVFSRGNTEREPRNVEEFWDHLKNSPSPEVRVRAFFVDQLSGPILQMLGTKFNIEPFFFSSSLKLIPTQYQEQGNGDHITITLEFIRPVKPPPKTSVGPVKPPSKTSLGIRSFQGPLELESKKNTFLLPDFLAFHIIRRTNSPQTPSTSDRNTPRSGSAPSVSNTIGDVSTIISYHGRESRDGVSVTEPFTMTTAKRLHDRLLAAGHSVYWGHIYKDTSASGDPNFIALTLLWYALYSWDEVYELLFTEVTELEKQTLSMIPSEDPDQNNPDHDSHSKISKFSHNLHLIRAHLLHHESLLIDFRKRVIFLRDAGNPVYTGKAGFAENTIYESGNTTKRRYSTRTGPLGPFGPLMSSSSRRRQSTSEPKREGDRPRQNVQGLEVPSSSGVHVLPTGNSFYDRPGQNLQGMQIPNSSGVHVLPTGNSFHNEPESDDDSEMQEMLRKAETEEAFRELLLFKECANLIHEIDRVEQSRDMLDRRLANLMGFAFSRVNIILAERSGQDSAIMRQISYLTMFFLPASVVATVLGMSALKDIDHLAVTSFFAASIPLTVIIWFLVQYDPANRLNIELIRTKSKPLFVTVALQIWEYIKYPFEWLKKGRNMTNDQHESA